MDRVGLVLVDLEPVAGGVAYPQDARGLRMLEGVEDGEGRALLRRTHVGEHQPPPHLDRIGALAEIVTNRAVGGLPGRVEDGAVDVEVPAVVAAADTALLYLAELERRAPVHAAPFQQPDPPASVAERHQVLAEDPDGPRKVIELRFHADGLPEAAQVLPAGRSVAHPAKLFVRMAVAVAVVGAVGALEDLGASSHGMWSWRGGGDAGRCRSSAGEDRMRRWRGTHATSSREVYLASPSRTRPAPGFGGSARGSCCCPATTSAIRSSPRIPASTGYVGPIATKGAIRSAECSACGS